MAGSDKANPYATKPLSNGAADASVDAHAGSAAASWLSRARDPGYSPARRHLPELLALLGQVEREDAEVLERALTRSVREVADDLLTAFTAAQGRARGRLAKVLVRGSSPPASPALSHWLGAMLDDPDPVVSRQAVVGAGKFGLSSLVPQLVNQLQTAAPAHQRAVVEALGKIGGPAATQALASLDHPADVQTQHVHGRAMVMATRDQARQAADGSVIGDALVPGQIVRLFYRPGLAVFGEDELAQAMERGLLAAHVGIVARRRETLDVVGLAHWRDLWHLRLPLHAVLVSRPPGLNQNADPHVIADAIASLAPVLREFAPPPWRFRLDWAGQGHRRAQTWQVASAIARTHGDFVNDSRQAPWEVTVHGGELELACKAIKDPRFDYRVADVPAASHPTVAAALARVAAPHSGEVVWDPFVGSAQELIECAKLAENLRLIGTDIDRDALAAAQANLNAAGLAHATLHHADATQFAAPAPSLVISNPPMGRRVHARADLVDLLLGVLAQSYRVLRRGGRVVWLSPHPQATQEAGLRLGFAVRELARIDLGGFWVALEVHTKR